MRRVTDMEELRLLSVRKKRRTVFLLKIQRILISVMKRTKN